MRSHGGYDQSNKGWRGVVNGEPEMPFTQLMMALCWLPSGDSWWRVKKRLESNKRQQSFFGGKESWQCRMQTP